MYQFPERQRIATLKVVRWHMSISLSPTNPFLQCILTSFTENDLESREKGRAKKHGRRIDSKAKVLCRKRACNNQRSFWSDETFFFFCTRYLNLFMLHSQHNLENFRCVVNTFVAKIIEAALLIPGSLARDKRSRLLLDDTQ